MADSSLPRTRDTSGTLDNIDTRTTTGGDHKQVVVPAGETDAEVAKFLNTAPAGSEYGLVVRQSGALPAGTNNVGDVDVLTLPALPAGTNNIGDVDVLTLPALPAGTNNIGDVDVLTLPALPAGTNNIGDVDVVSVPTLTKGTQGATGLTVQQLKDAGRNPVAYYTNVAVAGSSTASLLSLTGTKSGATVTATTTPAVVTAGKTLRITRFAASFIATATSVYAIVSLRYNTGGVVAITSPILAVIVIGAGTPATANSVGSASADIPDGVEVPAGAGIGISAITFSGSVATSGGFLAASVLGFEY